MRRTATYASLLAKTHFFKNLTREQLDWVVEHSKEWYARKGREITSSAKGPDNFWILLDGAWKVEHEDVHYHSGPYGPGNWFGGEWMPAFQGSARVVTTELSYVLAISLEDLREMAKQGFDFQEQQRAGTEYYEEILVR
jgi:signal-transduction protein with cAMP-binding, CBS, and nucleotidyltransferase domain